MKILVSKNDIISIDYFMKNYMGIRDYKIDGKITHNKVYDYLLEKGLTLPSKVNMKNIKKEQIVLYDILFVKDEIGSVIPYKNPRLSTNRLLEELERTKNINQLTKIRESILKDQGYEYGMLGLVTYLDTNDYSYDDYQINCHINRIKRKVNRR